MATPVRVPRELAKQILILGGLEHRQVPEEVRGEIAHVEQQVLNFNIGHRIMHIIVVSHFVGHAQIARMKSLRPAGSTVYFVEGGSSSIREQLAQIVETWNRRPT